MLKLVIVDDEYLFREAMKISLPWKELGFDVCCEAENGYDALEKIMELKPEVALVDINMPVMDGLELAAEIKERRLDVKIIIITGYGEFNYAKQAIEFGVVNYLLKPIEEDELMKALESIKSTIEKERAVRLDMEVLRRQADEHKPILKEMLLNDLIQGSRLLEDDEIFALKEYIELELDSVFYQAAIIELDEKKENGWNGNERRLWSFAVSNIAGELLGDHCRYELCRDIQGRINVIVLPEAGDDDRQMDLVGVFETIRLAVKSLGITITVGLGRPYAHIRELVISYKEAVCAVNNKLVIGNDSVILYKDIIDYKPKTNLYPIEQKMRLHMSLRSGDLCKAENTIRSIFNEIRVSNPSGEMALLVIMELASSLLETAIETDIDITDEFDRGFNILEEVQNKRNLDEMESWIMHLLNRIDTSISAGKSIRSSRIVENAKNYINENYTRFDLKIDEIAKSVFVKYGYLCFLFKRETGKTINEYISELRIYKAKELFDGGCRSISLVAVKVGYADANYFGKCFKKLTGVTPGQYNNHFNLSET